MQTKTIRLALAIYLVLGIFYILPPGGPQITDFFMGVVIFLLVLFGRLSFQRGDIYIAMFLLYGFLVNSVWAVYLQAPILLLASVYIAYNILVFMIFRKYFQGGGDNIRVILTAIVLAVLIEAVYMVFSPGNSIRAIGTFTNPNQLSYFAITFASMGLLLSEYTNKSNIRILILVFCWVVVLAGLSKAGIISMIYLTFAVTLMSKRNIIRNLLGLSVATVIMFQIFWEKIEAAQARIMAIGEDSDDSFTGRGYDRILNEIELVFLGAGEGDYRRHASVWGGEIHSSFGTILFCYGIIGFILFSLFLFRIAKVNPRGFIIYLTPLLLYSITHNGLRFTPFWITLACVSACVSVKKFELK